MTAPPEGTWIRLASGDRVYGKWHVSRGQSQAFAYGNAWRHRTTYRLLTRCGRYLEVDQVEPWTADQGRPRRLHFLTSREAPAPACGACVRVRSSGRGP